MTASRKELSPTAARTVLIELGEAILTRAATARATKVVGSGCRHFIVGTIETVQAISEEWWSQEPEIETADTARHTAHSGFQVAFGFRVFRVFSSW
jgi:hypothetical protein